MAKLPDLATFGARELLQLEEGIGSELRRRGLVRTRNKPLGDIAEQVVFVARGGVLEPNSTRSHDVTDSAGRKVQVKAISAPGDHHSGRFSAFRSFDFDVAVFLVFSIGTFELTLAREVTADVVENTATYSSHVNGSALSLPQVKDLGVDVTDEMREAYASFDRNVVEFRSGLTSGGKR